jgi:NADH-quinone oxidoreductase subunit L
MGRELSVLYLIPLFPLIGAALNLLIGRKLPRAVVHTIAISAVTASFVTVAMLVTGPLWDVWSAWSAVGRPEAINPGLHERVFTWIEAGAFKVELAFTLDALAAVMVLTITFVGLLIHIFSTGYMSHEPRYAAYFGYLNLFTGAMLILVLADSLPVMFIGWEGVGLCSYLLIGFWFDKEANANAGRKAFVVNRIGDFAFLLGMFLIYWQVQTLEFSGINRAAEAFHERFWFGERIGLICGVLLFIGACGKSAQIPLYVWLPDAMAGPTPVSALIHAATMVTAGVYMVARLSFLYAASTTAMAVVAGVGALTALVAAVIAFAQTDFKKVLAYSTVSQLGFMFVGVGVGAYAAGIFHLVTHAFFKAGLFLAAGSVMHAMSGSGDITKMGGLRRKLPFTHGAFVVYWLAICGIFPLSGFWSKDEILAGAFNAHAEGWWPAYGKALWLILTVAAVGTAFYMSRLYFLVFAGECRADEHTKAHIHESPSSMTVPLIILAGFTVVLGAIGLPHLQAVHLPTLLADWLTPSVTQDVVGHASDSTTLLLMAVAFGLAAVAILAARALYGNGPSPQVERLTAAGLGNAVLRVVRGKLYVDELYELIIIRPYRWLSQRLFEIVDRVIIDTILVNGSAAAVDLVGRLLRWVQNGQVQRYLVGLVFGAAALVIMASRIEATFTYVPSGNRTYAFRADTGVGPGAAADLVEWDFDADGKIDQTGPDPTHTFAQPGTYNVSMWVTDSVFGRREQVRKQITVSEAGQ